MLSEALPNYSVWFYVSLFLASFSIKVFFYVGLTEYVMLHVYVCICVYICIFVRLCCQVMELEWLIQQQCYQ